MVMMICNVEQDSERLSERHYEGSIMGKGDGQHEIRDYRKKH